MKFSWPIREVPNLAILTNVLDPPLAPTPCADVTRLRMLDLDAGKGRQIMKCSEWSASMLHYKYTLAEDLERERAGMCSREL